MESPTTTLAAAQLAATAPVRTHDPHRARTRSPRRAPRARRTAIAVICAIAAVALAYLAVSPTTALAAAGDLDPSFDGDGRLVVPFTGAAYDVLVQPDGKIVLAGYDEHRDFAVWRLDSDGSPDRGFDGDGSVAISFGSDDAIRAAALQSDGRIVVAGKTFTEQTGTESGLLRRTTFRLIARST